MNLVERLRACCECEQAPLGPLLGEAADEIERLTAQRDRLAEALGALMDAVSDMPADADECWPDEWAAARAALESIK